MPSNEEAANQSLLDNLDDEDFSEEFPEADGDNLITNPIDRLTDRAEEPPPAETPVEEEDMGATPRSGKWGSKPVHPRQAIDYPDSVRQSGMVSHVLDLSKPDDLSKLNELQSAASEEGPSIAIRDYERQFHEGKFTVFLTTTNIEYQQI